MVSTEHGEYDRGTSTDQYLIEVRTVLSRAETALAEFEHNSTDKGLRWYIVPRTPIRGPDEPFEWTDRSGTVHRLLGPGEFLGYSEGVWIDHPDGEAMRSALVEVVKLLSPFRRTGRARRKR